MEKQFENGTILKMIDENNKIIGSVRTHSDDNRVYIGKLMVHPAPFDEDKTKNG